MSTIKNVKPVKGAAEYYSGYDYQKNKKPCVIMKNTEGDCSIIEYASTIEKAIKKAIRWQEKENKAVLAEIKTNSNAS